MKNKVGAETRAIIERAVIAHLSGLKLTSIDVRHHEDRDGMVWLDIGLHYAADDSSMTVQFDSDMRLAINDALLPHGKPRMSATKNCRRTDGREFAPASQGHVRGARPYRQ